MTATLKIGDKTYNSIDPMFDEYILTIDEMRELKLTDMPTHARVYVRGFKVIDGVVFTLEAKAQNNEDGIFHQIGFTISFKDKSKSRGEKRLTAIRNYFSILPKGWEEFYTTTKWGNWYGTSYWLNEKKIIEDKPIIKHYKSAMPIINRFKTSRVRAFLCHSSEDKPIVEKIANRIRSNGSIVWFDKWEIKAGDSIVEKINAGLEDMTHLLLFVSKSSINKPWVKKELSVGIMRKLKDNSVKVIPVLLDKVDLPMIISDIKYANCIAKTEQNFDELIEVLIEK